MLSERVRSLAGWALIWLGVVFWAVPILPGTVLVVAGVALVGTDHPRIRPLLTRLKLVRRNGKRKFAKAFAPRGV